MTQITLRHQKSVIMKSILIKIIKGDFLKRALFRTNHMTVRTCHMMQRKAIVQSCVQSL